ncbi:MAG TPA: phosphatase PAP2 family protein [Planctomycetota bacterium]|nr:phosphatase PAP2 family protein [Planctomycetota bacterium]
MHPLTLLLGLRALFFFSSGEGSESDQRRPEHLSLYGPSVERDAGPDSLDRAPAQRKEDDEEVPFLTSENDDKVSPFKARSWTAFIPPLSADPLQAPPPKAGQEKPAPQAPPPKEEPFEPPHGSWAGVGKHFSSQAWKEDVWNDYLTTPEVLLPIGLAVSAAAISHWDKPLQHHWLGLLGNHRSYSDIGQDALIGLVVLDGVLLPGEGRNWWDDIWTIGEAYGASSLTVFMLKTAVQRPRPGGSASGIGTHSFPSGHSQSAFTAATLIERNSGPLFGLPSYGLAAFTAFQRVEEGHHYPSDILAGAAIGVLSASIFDSLHWGSGPGDGGIARPGADAKLGFLDGLHGFTFELNFGF